MRQEAAMRIVGQVVVVGHSAVVKFKSSPTILLILPVVECVHPFLVGRVEDLGSMVVVDGGVETGLAVCEHIPISL